MVALLLSALSGTLLSAAFEPVGKWWVAPIAIAVHMYALSISSRKVLSSFIFGLTLNLIVLHWSSTFVGSIPWVILAIGLSLFYLPLALVSKWGITAYPLIYILLEEVRNRFPFGGFGWVRIAFTQADAPYAKVAAIGGATALSAAVVLIALVIFHISHRKISLLPLLPFLIVLVPINTSVIGSTNVLMIQGNVPQMGLDFNSRAKAVFKNHFERTQMEIAKNPNVDFILWPENSVDVDPFLNSDVKKSLDSIKQPLIIGAIVNKGNRLLNTSILWGEELPETYIKQHLTPFGEYIPLRSLARIVSPLVDEVEDFSPGDSGKTFEIDTIKVAPVICYELIDDTLLEKAAKNSNILAVQTNSATFGMSAESAQQLSITRIRAIEHGRHIASVSTTGYSAIIDSSGKVLQKTSMGTADSIRASVDLIEGQTPRDRAGDWALIGVLAALFLVARRAYI
ncbi:Lnt Apolipoprotein N-acyltransferase [Candidatus Nanopelagicaceae bacterium]